MNKTPYEIRLDVLQMAKDMLDKEANYSETAYTMSLNTALSKTGAWSASDVLNVTAAIPQPIRYSEQDIITRSTALLNFINATGPYATLKNTKETKNE